MTILEELMETALESGISVIDAHFSKTKKAACMYDNDMKLIVMDKPAMESTEEETVILAEEIAHYETGSLYMIQSTYNTPLARSNRRKYESTAKQRAAVRLCPLDELQRCFENHMFDIYEIAERLSLTPEYVSYAINMYTEKKGLLSI